MITGTGRVCHPSDWATAMKVILSVTAGPFQGRRFTFEGHDTFLVGRVNDAHLQLPYDDPYFSRRHFVLEINPPRCRLLDLGSRNGTFVNGQQVSVAEIRHGDVIKAGHTVFEVSVEGDDPVHQVTVDEYATVGPPTAPGHSSDRPAVPGYEIVEEIGRGSMGVVYRARRQADGVAVAVKTIVPPAGTSARCVERFLREAKVLEQLRHPNVVAFHDGGMAAGVIYLAMELVNGPDAGRRLAEKGPMKVEVAVRIVCQMLKGLHHAHEQGFVHRDVKPANLLIHEQARRKVTKLADFGLARAYESSRLSGLTLLGEVGGTPAFMAPEQVTHYRDARPAADQYSSAATLYTLLTGQLVHDLPAGVPQQLVHITSEPPVPIRSRRADVPAGLAEVIHRALRREPGERYADVAALRGELKKFA
jgi:serine/threonine-protein kinase